MAQYDYLIVGAGLFGATFAHHATQAGKKCLIVEKRPVPGGNVRCDDFKGINVHLYGPHIFHTNSKMIWDYVNSFVPFNRFTFSPFANDKGRLYNLPFNMNTFYQLWGISEPKIAKEHLARLIPKLERPPANLEERAISLVGLELYKKFIKGFTQKNWGRIASSLPASIINRIPVRYVFDNNYFNDYFQGIPEGGYNKIIDEMIKDSHLALNQNFFSNRSVLESEATKNCLQWVLG